MFGQFSSYVIFFLVGSVTAILLYLLFISWRNPVLAKLGLRSLARRPTQTALIIIGLTLSTVIIISSLGTGDTLRYSVQRQSVAAYGKVDEIIAPPLISMLTNMGNPNASNEQAQQARSTLEGVMKGGVDSVLALAQGGLPSISVNRLEQLRMEAAKEPLIDGVAGAIVFPTIIRNATSGASEPIGFIYAVDDHYPQTFGLRSVTGESLAMDTLQPGIGNVFLQSSRLLAFVPQITAELNRLAANVPSDLGATAPISGSTTLPSGGALAEEGAPPLAAILAGLGAVITGVDPQSLPDISISLDTLDQLGVNTQPLRALGKQTIGLRELAAVVQALAQTEAAAGDLLGGSLAGGQQPALPAVPVTATLATGLGAGAQVTDTELLSATVEALATSSLSPSRTMTGSLAALQGVSGDLLRAINLNTIGYDLDKVLSQYGLQLRQGDLYLNRLGAQRLSANVGDVVEVYIGPLPVRFRVRAVVDEAGPLSALMPVVMLRLSEAQQLLFMDGKVNAVLVSNQGDEMTGMQHTDAVSKRLRVLALDSVAVGTVADILRRSDVRTIVEREAASLPPTSKIDVNADGDVPPVVAGILDSLLQSLPIDQASQQDVKAMMAALQANDEDALREVLAQQSMHEWLLNLPLPPSVAGAFGKAVSNLNQFEQIDPLNKTTIVAAANIGGGVFSSIFSIFGIFSILAALLLIVLIFVMLAAERRVEIGVARAVGVQRGQIVQMFMTEGMVYNLAAGALGVLLGIGITYAMTAFIGRLFNDATGQINSQVGGIFAVSFQISWESVVTAYCLGVLITWLAMTFATGRVSTMNIVTAIRNLPDEAESKRRSWLGRAWRWGWPIVVTGLGLYLLWQAYTNRSLSLAMIALTVTLYGATTLIGRIIELTPLRNETGYTIVYSLLGLGLLAIWVPPWYAWAPQLWPGMFTWDPTQAPTVFTIGGPLIIIGVILLVMFNARFLSSVIAALLGFIPSLRPVLKTAIAYPLSTRFRTGMTMVLFAMIMATVVVMAVILNTTQSLIRLDPRQTAGFDLRVSPTLLSFFSPIDNFAQAVANSDEALRSQVAAVGAITNQFVQAREAGAGAGYEGTGMTGVNDGYVSQARKIYHMQARAPGFADDAAVWDALVGRDDVVIIKPSLLQPRTTVFGDMFADDGARNRRRGIDQEAQTTTDQPVQPGTQPGDEFGDEFGDGGPSEWRSTFRLADLQVQGRQIPELYLELTTLGQDGVTRNHKVQVIGVLADEDNLAPAELIGSEAALTKLRSVPVKGDELFVKTVDGADPQEVAAKIEGTFVASGLNASVIADEYAQRQRLTGGALQLLQGFMALGLLVGIAALGVISVRSVIERRQQIGMLRALGFQSSMVGLAFVIESSFVSITGLLIGALTGIVLGNSLVGAFFPQLDRSIVAIPWEQIALIVVATYLFSLLTTILPAWQASRIYPAEALRYE
ncbi:MAG: FtsX-like permease family protein [Caldilineaceae bacterium]